MAFFADLTEYQYVEPSPFSHSERASSVLNIGWLDSSHEFEQGPTSKEFQRKLLLLCCFKPVQRTRGFHRSWLFDYLDEKGREINAYPVKIGDKRYNLGSAEIRIKLDQTTDFASPNLIIHYVMDGFYRPPEQFISSVMTCNFGDKEGLGWNDFVLPKRVES